MLIFTRSRSSGKKTYSGKFFFLLISLTLISFETMAQSGNWSKKAQAPVPAFGLSAAVVNNKIYAMGGIKVDGATGSFVQLPVVQVYDPASDTWQKKKDIPTERSLLSTAAADGIIYAIGGWYDSTADAYDPDKDTWSKIADMQSPKFGAASAAVNGVIYTIGGSTSGRNMEAYDPKTNTWTSKKDIPYPASLLAAVEYNGLIYTFGGAFDGGTSNSVYAYDPKTDTWTKKSSMPTPRNALQACLLNGKIYAIGGGQAEGVHLASVEVYDPEKDTWTKEADMPVKLAFFAAAVVNEKIYVIGGTPDLSAISQDIWVFDPTSPIELSPSGINFGSVLFHDSSDTATVTIRNQGSEAFSINSLSTNRPEFSLTGLPAFPAVLAPSDSLVFGVIFKPVRHETAYGEVIITTNNTKYPSSVVGLSGKGIACGTQFNMLIHRVSSAMPNDRSAIIDSFFQKNPVMPFIEEDSVCQFLYRGDAQNVYLSGDANGWSPNGLPMTRLSATNLWYSTDVFETNARLEYKFVLNGSNWILDPRNPYTFTGGYGPNSQVAMPHYVFPPEMKPYQNIPHGTLYDTTFRSNILGNSRTVRVYTPPEYTASGSDTFNVVVFHDGLEWVSLAFAQNALDYLIYHKRVPPLIAVFVPPVNREPEYVGTLQDQFAEFIGSELMPYIDKRYRTKLNPDSRATVGISNGGNIALWIQYKYPELFGNAASYSGNIQYTTAYAFQNSGSKPSGIYIDAGKYDLYNILNITKNFREILDKKGISYRFYEWPEGHSWGSWGGHLDNALEFFFPVTTLGIQKKQEPPASFALLQNYPNPFNPSTTIKYSIPKESKVTLSVYNTLGERLRVLVDETLKAGSYEVTFISNGLPSGVYFYTLEARPASGDRSFRSTKKFILLK